MGRLALGRLSLGRLGRSHRELLGHLDLEFAAHADLDPERVSRRLRSTMATWSSGPSRESTAPASADSTVQAKVSLPGMHGSAAATETVIVISSVPRSNTHSTVPPRIASRRIV